MYPTYHWNDILGQSTTFDYIIRGEGERTMRLLAQALADGGDVDAIGGLAFLRDGRVHDTGPADAALISTCIT